MCEFGAVKAMSWWELMCKSIVSSSNVAEA